MYKNRPVLKKCPECGHSAHVATKICGNKDCGYSFHDAKQKKSQATEEQPRRTKRVRRENPKFSGSGDAVETPEKENDGQKRQKMESQENPLRRTSQRTKESKEIQTSNRLRKAQEMKNRREDICGQLSQEKQALAAFYLSEINRKFGCVAWRP